MACVIVGLTLLATTSTIVLGKARQWFGLILQLWPNRNRMSFFDWIPTVVGAVLYIAAYYHLVSYQIALELVLAIGSVHAMVSGQNDEKKQQLKKAVAERLYSLCTYLSHEIRNQIHRENVILDQMKEEKSEWTDHVTMMMNATANVNTILDDAVDLARWESGQCLVNFASFPITRLFKSIASYATEKVIVVEELTPISPTWHVSADEHLLNKAVANLVSNAWKYGQGRPISVVMAFEKTDDKHGAIVVTVTDKGCGMTPDQLDRATEAFVNVREGDHAQEGMRLSLSLTKSIIEVGHKGTLSLSSEGIDTGVTATIRVPVLWEDKTDTSRPNMEDPLWWVKPHPGATADVLVVDDSRLNRRMVTFAAKKLGLSVEEAVDGAEAVECLRTKTYSIVFMDQQMPVMKGDVATEQARANGYTLPIVMVSSDSFSPSDRISLKQRGITAFLDKAGATGARQAMKKLKELL